MSRTAVPLTAPPLAPPLAPLLPPTRPGGALSAVPPLRVLTLNFAHGGTSF